MELGVSVSSIGCMNLHPIGKRMGKRMQDEGRVVQKK
jgi:hypothetical protein